VYFNRKERRNWWKLRIDWFVQTFWKETRFWFRLVFVRRAAIGRAATGAVQSAATLHLCFSHCQGERKMQKHMESVYKSIYNRYAETHTHSHTHTHTQTRSWWKDLLNPPQKKENPRWNIECWKFSWNWNRRRLNAFPTGALGTWISAI